MISAKEAAQRHAIDPGQLDSLLALLGPVLRAIILMILARVQPPVQGAQGVSSVPFPKSCPKHIELMQESIQWLMEAARCNLECIECCEAQNPQPPGP